MMKKTVKPPIVQPSLDASLDESLTDHCGRIVGSSMEERSGTLEDALGDDDEQWIATVMSSLDKRSVEVKEALGKALLSGENDVMPLLGLELTDTESTQEIIAQNRDSNRNPVGSPLLGTNASQQSEIIEKSSLRRSEKRSCYTVLLHNEAPSSSLNHRISNDPGPSNCLLIYHRRWERSTSENFIRLIAC